MLDTRQFLLAKLAEECTEVAQRALKQIQFGRDEIQPNEIKNPDAKSNHQRLMGELSDLFAILGMLEKIGEIEFPDYEEMDKYVKAKQEKVSKYRQYSQSLGMIEPEKCIRCGVGDDHDQDGNCAVCHTLPDSHAADLKETR